MVETLDRLSELTTQLAKSELGQELARRPRFQIFKPDAVSAESWEQLLDSDVNNFRHNALTAALGYMICCNETASLDATQKVIITAGIHDIPEIDSGDENGDIPLGLVTETDEKHEYSYLKSLGDNPTCAITPTEAADAEQVMLDSKQDRVAEEGGLFWLTEKLGYFRTAYIAYDVYRDLPNTAESQDLKNHLLYMWSDIFGNSYEDLVKEVGKYKSIGDVFVARFEDLTTMYDLTMSSLFEIKEFYLQAGVSGREFIPEDEIFKIVNGFGAHIFLEQLLNLWHLS